MSSSQRPPALDWMRGLVMVLMASGHAAAAFDGGRRITDSSRMQWLQVGKYPPSLTFAALALVVLVPACLAYGRSKTAPPRSVLRYS